MILRKRFDFVFSIGEDCGCAMNLRRFGLRIMSSPFDWVNSATFGTRIDLLCKDFDGFCSKEDLVHEDKNPNASLMDHAHELFRDTRCGFRFVHDFDEGVPLDLSYPGVHEKYARRIARTLGKIRQSRHVLAVWWSRNKVIPSQEIVQSAERLRKAFPDNDMNLLVCQNTCWERKPISYVQMGETGMLVLAHFCPDVNKTDGDEAMNRAIFKRIRVSREIHLIRMRRLLVSGFSRFFGLWHFSREGRVMARRKYRRLAETWIRRNVF